MSDTHGRQVEHIVRRVQGNTELGKCLGNGRIQKQQQKPESTIPPLSIPSDVDISTSNVVAAPAGIEAPSSLSGAPGCSDADGIGKVMVAVPPWWPSSLPVPISLPFANAVQACALAVARVMLMVAVAPPSVPPPRAAVTSATLSSQA